MAGLTELYTLSMYRLPYAPYATFIKQILETEPSDWLLVSTSTEASALRSSSEPQVAPREHTDETPSAG